MRGAGVGLLGGRECARRLRVDQLASTVASHEAHAAEQRGAAARLIQEVRTVEAQCAKFEAARRTGAKCDADGRLAAAEARGDVGAAAGDATAARTALAAVAAGRGGRGSSGGGADAVAAGRRGAPV